MSTVGGAFNSASEAFDQRAAASDQAALGYGAYSQIGATNIGRSATLKTGGIDLTKATVGKGGTLEITVNDTQPLTDLSTLFASTVQNLNSNASQQLSNALTATGDQLKEAFAQLATLGQSTTTGGDSERNKIILYVVLGLLAVVGLIFYWRH